MTEGYREVLDHLLFHKALEEENTQKIDGYVHLLSQVQEGYTFAEEARYERSIAAAFQLVLEQAFDPWDIDLVGFSKAYMHRVRELGTVNFITAGRLVRLAWSVLKLQSEFVLSAAEPVNPPAEDPFEAWDVAPGFYEEPADVDLTHDLLTTPHPPLKEAMHRDVTRPVTLVDLLDAFAQAFQEASGAVAAPRRAPPIRADVLRGKLHQDDLVEDLQWTWEAITGCGQDAVGLSQLTDGDPWDRATCFLSILFLARLGWIDVWQEDFPWGEVYVRPLHAEDPTLPAAVPAVAEVA